MNDTVSAHITDEMIQTRIKQVAHATSGWTGYMPPDAESYDDQIIGVVSELSIENVRTHLLLDNIDAETPAEELDMAISDALESLVELPENCCVEVYYA